MANDVLRRIKENEVIKVQKRKKYMRYMISITAMLLVSIVGFNIWNEKNPVNAETMGGAGNTGYSDEVSKIYYTIHYMGTSYELWNGKWISWNLLDTFRKNEENRQYNIKAIYTLGGKDNEFSYNEKSLAEYETEKNLLKKLEKLLEEGEYLKYGEVLYLTGTPEGVIWEKDMYDKMVFWYGQDMLNKYIQNGEFLKGQVENDLQALSKTQAEYEIALRAYTDTFSAKLKESLQAQGIDFTADVDGLIIHATEAEFEKFEMEYSENWKFGLK